jgi:hypothetical protein
LLPGSLENLNMPQEPGLIGLVSRQQECDRFLSLTQEFILSTSSSGSCFLWGPCHASSLTDMRHPSHWMDFWSAKQKAEAELTQTYIGQWRAVLILSP